MTTAEMAGALQVRDHFLIITHKRPDGDTVGSASALCRGLRSIGKTAWLLPNPELTKRLNPFTDDLTAPPEYMPETVVAVDIASKKLFPENADGRIDKVDLCIDHHASNDDYATQTLVEPGTAACGELVYAVLRDMNVEICPKTASSLYLAISTDTGCFKFRNTTSHTHQIAARLMELGCDAAAINKAFFSTKTAARLEIERRIMDGWFFRADKKVAVVTITRAMIDETGVAEEDLDDISALPREIEGVEAAVTIRELAENGGTKISLRTGALVDASEICRRFGGGGHAGAAGCSFVEDVEKNTASFIDAVERTVMANA